MRTSSGDELIPRPSASRTSRSPFFSFDTLTSLELGFVSLAVTTSANAQVFVEAEQVVLELAVDGPLRCRQLDRHNLLRVLDEVDLRPVLPHVLVEEALRDLVAALVPSSRVHFAIRVEPLSTRLLVAPLGGSRTSRLALVIGASQIDVQ